MDLLHRKFAVFGLTLLLALAQFGAAGVWAGNEAALHHSVDRGGWRLVFADEFDGDVLDETKWSRLPMGGRIAPRKDGYWSHDEVFLDGNGHLIVQVSEHNGGYHTGGISTRGKFEHAYGYYEIRAQLPKERGFWAAFWLMTDGVHSVGNQGRDGTEIDIFESPYAHADTIHHALHWDGYGENHRSIGRDVHIPGIYDGFHTFAVEWNEEEYIYYVDGVETWRTSAGGVSQVPSYIKVTAEVGAWGGDIRQANLPDHFVVDYVRVYAKDHKIEIEAPERDAVVAADGPVRFRIDPDVTVREIRVHQNDSEIYRGSVVPQDLTLALPVLEDEEEHRLTVTVVDEEGREHERSVRFRVQQLKVDITSLEGGRVREVVDVRAAAGFAGGEQPVETKLLLRRVGLVEEDAALAHETVLYEGTELPCLALDTRELADGPYDMVLNVRTDQGRALEIVERIVVDNWQILDEPFAAPIVFFGMAVDSLLTTERSQGWTHVTDNPEQFFGDGGRLAAIGDGDPYLVWQQPRLRTFQLELYARNSQAADRMRFEASADGTTWQALMHEVAVEGQSDEGWYRLKVTGSVPAECEADLFRLTLTAGGDYDSLLQLGRLMLTSQK